MPAPTKEQLTLVGVISLQASGGLHHRNNTNKANDLLSSSFFSYTRSFIGGLNLRSLKAFVTTVTEENAIAPAAKMGLRRIL